MNKLRAILLVSIILTICLTFTAKALLDSRTKVQTTPIPPPEPKAYYDAIQLVNDSAVSVTYTYGNRVVLITNADQAFFEILRFLKSSNLLKVTPKTIINKDGSTAIVGIPYVIGCVLTFKLENSDTVSFDVAYKEIWFETNKGFYEASCTQDFYDFLSYLGKQLPP